MIADTIAQVEIGKNSQEKGSEKMGRLEEFKNQRGKNPYEKGSRYYDLWEANPYTAEKFTREQTGWDRLANGLGFRSGYDAALDEWMAAYQKENARIAQMKADDQYNSPEQQAARMRAAGQNPDLLGTEGVESASETSQEYDDPNVNAESQDVERFSNFVGDILKGITFGLSMSQEVAGTINAWNDVNGKVYDNGKKLGGLAQDFVNNFTPDLKGKSMEEIGGELTRAANEWTRSQGWNKKQSDLFSKNVLETFQNNRGKAYDKWEGTLKSRQEYTKTNASRYTTQKDDDQATIRIIGELIRQEDNIIFWDNKNREQKSAKDAIYQQHRDAETQAEGENAENQNKRDKATMRNMARKPVSEALEKLGKLAEGGDPLAMITHFLISNSWLKWFE